jgi:crossover junction endodeoxyribonuclease RusA
MTITLPLPAKGLSPNSRLHWRGKSRLIRLHRTRAATLTRAAIGADPPPAFSGYSLAFHFPDRRHRDDDNAEASTKSYRDGIADALKMDDFHLPRVSVSTFHHDPANPRLEITLHP